MKKVLVYGLNNVRGGIEKYLLDLQRQLCSDVAFTYMMEECECIHNQTIRESGGDLVYYPKRKPLGQYISEMRSLLKSQREDSEILYMNLSDIKLDNLIVMLLGLHYQYKVIVHSHAAQLERIPSVLHRILHWLVVAISKWTFTFSKVQCYAVSDRAGDYLFSGKPYAIATPGIEVGKFAFDPQKRQEIRCRLGCQDAYVYGFIGRLVEIKNPDYLLEVFHSISCKSQQECRLLIVGSGPLLEDLQRQAVQLGISDRVTFLGDTPDPAQYYQAMDYLILPSQSEGLSLVAIEAQASGLPIACSAGRFPATIALTPLVNFVALEDGTQAWADACIAHGKRFHGDDRAVWNAIVYQSEFECQKATDRLKQILSN